MPRPRWSPTPQQLMILQDLYRKGLRNPTSSQVQKITAHLSLYGKIQCKNVFYWFQNHKARDRQKLRKEMLQHKIQKNTISDNHDDDDAPPQLQINNNTNILDYNFPPTTVPTLYPQYSPAILLHQGEGKGTSSAHQMMNNMQGNVDFPKHCVIENGMIRTNVQGWVLMMTDNMGPNSIPCCSNKPLQTLELFPIKATGIKE